MTIYTDVNTTQSQTKNRLASGAQSTFLSWLNIIHWFFFSSALSPSEASSLSIASSFTTLFSGSVPRIQLRTDPGT